MNSLTQVIKKLSNETGVSVSEAKGVLSLCTDYAVAKEYLRLKYDGVARYKIIGGQRIAFSDNDYVILAAEIGEDKDAKYEKSNR